MVIDLHAHVGDFRWSPAETRPVMSFQALIARLDDERIDRAVLLPVYNASPEQFPWAFLAHGGMSVREQVLEAERYRDRLVAFGNMDPRWGGNSDRTDFSPMLDWFQTHGCRGIGEVTANIPFDDPRTINLFRQLGRRGLPVTIESCNSGWGLGLQDDPGSPRLERLLRACPETVVIGHGPGFWAELGPVESQAAKMGYPRGAIRTEGSLARLLRSFPNLYADLSAKSAFNALARDLEYGIRFITEFQDRLLFGTDIVSRDLSKGSVEREQVAELIDGMLAEGAASERLLAALSWHNGVMPQRQYLETLAERGRISRSTLGAILGGNAEKLLDLA